MAPLRPSMGLSQGDEPSGSAAHTYTNGHEPPYTAPPDVLYPENTVANPHVASMAVQPTFANLPAGSLFRPQRLPSDMDIRLQKSSVWMGLDKTTHQAVYFLPPTCTNCAAVTGAHCDRGYPSCQRCTLKLLDCTPGVKWSQMKQKGKRKSGYESFAPALTAENLARAAAAAEAAAEAEDARTRLSAAEKGKGRAHAHAHDPPLLDQRPFVSLDPEHIYDDEVGPDEIFPLESQLPQFPRIPSPMSPIAGGRGKRTKKKRRLSLDEEIDPELLDDEGNLLPPKRKRSPLKPAAASTDPPPPLPASWDPEPSSAVDAAADAEYFVRIDRNNRKPPLKNMRAACPAWATTRRALQGGAEYLRDPSRIEGGSVEIGVGGVARGVILEGKSVGGGNFWGTRSAAGSVMVSLGSARRRRMPYDKPPKGAPLPSDRTHPSNAAGSSLPRVNVLPNTIHIEQDGSSPICPTIPFAEEPEIEALLMAQRARVPMAIAVAQDYLEPPFKVPRAFVVLGWFWLTDAWLEPEDLWEAGTQKSRRLLPDEIDFVRWKFRFEWCRGLQGVPWWSPNDDPGRPPTPYIEYKFVIEPLNISGPGIKGASTVIHPSARATTDHRTECGECGMVSEAVYRDAKVCLNEICLNYFMPAGAGGPVGLDPISKTPCLLRPVQRKTPEFLGLKLRGYDPHVASDEGLDRSRLGSDFWQGWICGKCGMANERRRWSGWDCDGCKHYVAPPRRPIAPERLLNPLHPGIKRSGAPRPDIGYPSFPRPFKITSGFTTYEHHIKVVKHSIELHEERSEVYHALHARRDNVVDVASRIWREMQGEGGEERKTGFGSLLKRRLLSNVSRRPAERHLSPFYTLAAGPDGPVRISGLPPSLGSMPWYQAPVACLDAMDLINFRAGCMFPGLTERFNSLIIAVTPPPMLSAPPPSGVLQAGEYLSILVLGSEACVSIRPLASSELGTVIVQHGDVLGLMPEQGGLEVSIKMDGFGAICFGQQVFPAIAEPGIGAFTITSDKEPQSIDLDAEAAKGERIPSPALPPLPPKPTVFTPAPLTDWYIGPRPLDINQPLRVRRPTRAIPRAAKLKAMEIDEEMAGNEENASPPVEVEVEVDPEHATGYIFIDDLLPDGASPPGSPKVIACDIPPSPTITPSVPAPKRRGPAAIAPKGAAAGVEDAATPEVPRKKRKYVFKNKPVAAADPAEDGEEVEVGEEIVVDSQATSAVKPKAKSRAKPGAKGRSKRVSDIGGAAAEEDGVEGSSPVGTVVTALTGGTESTGSPVKKKRAPAKPRKSAAQALAVVDVGEGSERSTPKVKGGRKRKSRASAEVEMELVPVDAGDDVVMLDAENGEEEEGSIIAAE